MFKTKSYIRSNKLKFDANYKELLVPVIFCDLRPSNMIYFNDVSGDARTLSKAEKKVYNDLHTKERHSGITVVWALHSTTYMPKEIRGQIKYHIFVSPSTLVSYIDNSNVDNNLKKRLGDACESILVADKERPIRKYTVVLYDKLNDKIYYTMADTKAEQQYVGDVGLYNALIPHATTPHLDSNCLIDEIFN